MKLKSLLFGSAASLVAFTGAQAADLPIAEPVDYVRICDAFGAGYYFLPGTETCLKIGGTALLDIVGISDGDGIFEEPGEDEFGEDIDISNNFGTRARGEINVDARTSTELGVLRAYIAFRGEADSRPPFVQSFREQASDEFGVPLFRIDGSPVFASTDGDDGNDSFSLDKAYLQLIGERGTLTAGHASSAFDFFGSYAEDFVGFFDDPTGTTNQLSFAANIGSFAAIIAIEDPEIIGRRADDEFFSGGRDLPDLVGALLFEQAAFALQLSGAVGEVATAFDDEDDEWGYAVALGGRVGFGMFEASAQATYAEGLVGYATVGQGLTFSDAISDAGDDIDLNEAWSIRAGVQANFTDRVYASVTGAYAEYDSNTDFDEDDFSDDYESWSVVGNLGFSPVSGLSVIGEVQYSEVDGDSGDFEDDDDDDGDIFGAGVRIRRDF